MKCLQLITATFFCILFSVALTNAQIPTALTAPAKPSSLPRSDRQIWNESQFRVDLSKRLTLNLLQFTRIGTEDGFRSDLRTGAGVIIKINQHYSIQPTYVYQYAHPGGGRSNYSHRLYVDHLLKFKAAKKVAIPLRIRTERIVRNSGSDYWNFRIRPGIEVPVRIGDHWVTLFANNESFYDTRYQAWSRQRFIAGISKKLSPKVTADFFYQQQFDSRSKPGNLKVFGTTFRFHLRTEK